MNPEQIMISLAELAACEEYLPHSSTCVIITQLLDQPPWPLVRERTIPTERPPLVDEI
jgi:hypothetical protein